MIRDVPARSARLLPWPTPEGNPCYVLGDGTGHIARMADHVESVQLEMAADLLTHVADLLSDRRATPEQLRFVTARMAESLRDVHRVARSRGDRIECHPGGDDEAHRGLEREPDEGTF